MKNNKQFPTLEEFAQTYPQYPSQIISIYQIVRDLQIKNNLSSMKILDGFENLILSSYLILGKIDVNETGGIEKGVSTAERNDQIFSET